MTATGKPPQETNGLVNGSYNNGTVAVTNGNHFSVSAPANYSLTDVPLIVPVDIAEGDVIGIKFATKPFSSGTTRWYARTRIEGGSTKLISLVTSAPAGGVWYDVTAVRANFGQMFMLRMEARTANLSGEFDVSIRVNGEVIF